MGCATRLMVLGC
ncbi:TPA: hypothetical protein N0F65_000158 [Lagenidium giganteum]|uniref:Uncharacterized protein n=1 Tax=Lagenidium giganteum TaxID=4803 RepID=A0AAV2YNI8_9STRA|nr:TPA: hypothetical protein N0F65_000158 [Lagenidium giganteum]